MNDHEILESKKSLLQSQERLVRETVELNTKLSNIGSLLMIFGIFLAKGINEKMA